MLNDYLSDKEAKERIKESIREAETSSLLRRLGYHTNQTASWILFLLIAVVIIGLMI